MFKNIIAKFDNDLMVQKTFNQNHIIIVDPDAVQLFDGKIIRYDFAKDKQSPMYDFFKDMQDNAKFGGKYDIDEFTIHIKNNVIYVVSSFSYEITSNKAKKNKLGYSTY